MRFLYLLAMLPMTASAMEWHQLSGSDDMAVYVDKDSIAFFKNGTRKAWVVQSHDAMKKTSGSPVKEYQSSMSLTKFNCSERVSGVYHQVLFKEQYRKGETVDIDVLDPEKIRLDDVLPGSVGEEILDYVCRHKIGKAR